MTAIQRDYYKVLQVDPEASPEVINAAYKVLAKRFHPETDLTGVHEIRLAELNRAYGVLKSAALRRAYDEERAERLSPVGPGAPEAVLVPAMAAPPPRTTSADGTPDGDSMLTRNGVSGPPPSITSAEASTFAGDMRLDFGRYAGWSLHDLARKDPAYLRWLARHSSGLRFRREIARALGEPLEDPYAPSR
jgi:curved DNA-binding protein CbpA